MAWLIALFRRLFPAAARSALLCAAWIGPRIILDALVDPGTGAIRPDTADSRRKAAQCLHDCALALFHALDERAREIAGLPQRRLCAADVRMSELHHRDVSALSLVKRARALMDQIRRFESLARRRALRLQRHAARREAMREPATLAIFVLMLLCAFTPEAANAPRMGDCQRAFADARIRAPP